MKNFITTSILSMFILFFSQSKILAQAPIISGFSPMSAKPSDMVVITGSGFSGQASMNIVFFGATRAVVTNASATSLTVSVPYGAVFGPISVLNVSTNKSCTSRKNFNPIFFPSKNGISSRDFLLKASVITGNYSSSLLDNEIALATGDLDLDGKPDIVVANKLDNTISIIKNNTVLGSLGCNSFAEKIDISTSSGPSCLALSDVNNDGKLDILVGNYNDHSFSVFPNISSLGLLNESSFGPHVDFTAGQNPSAISTGDLDGDGKVDVVVTNFNSTGVSVFHNTITGNELSNLSFASKVDFAVGLSQTEVKLVDWNEDNKLDIVSSGVYGTRFLQNNSVTGSINAQSFGSSVYVSDAGGKLSITDLDGDSKLDLIVASNNGGKVFRNIYNPSLGAITSSISLFGFYPSYASFGTIGTRSVSIGDFDGDGKPDILRGSNYNGFSENPNVAVYRNNASPESFSESTLGSEIVIGEESSPSSNLSIDLDGDGLLDVISAHYKFYNGQRANVIFIYRNSPPPPIIVSFSPSSAIPDEEVSITGSGFDSNPQNNIVYFGSIQAEVISATNNTLTVEVPQGATYSSLQVVNKLNDQIGQSLIKFSPKFFPEKEEIGLGDYFSKVNFLIGEGATNPTQNKSVVLGDLNNDSKSEMIVINILGNGVSQAISIFKNISASSHHLSASSFAEKVDFIIPVSEFGYLSFLTLADMNLDGKQDIVASSTSGIIILRNSTSSSEISNTSFDAPYMLNFPNNFSWDYLGSRNFSLGDIDLDGLIDIVCVGNTSNGESVLAFKNISPIGCSMSFDFKSAIVCAQLANQGFDPTVFLSDMDVDGKLDLVVAGLQGVFICRNTGTNGLINNSTFSSPFNLSFDSSVKGIEIADLDGNGKPDIVALEQVYMMDHKIQLLFNNSTIGIIDATSFTNPVELSIGQVNGDKTLCVTDVNGDGKVDLAIFNSVLVDNSVKNYLTLVQNNSTVEIHTNESFSHRVNYWLDMDELPTRVVSGDLDGNGTQEIVFCFWTSVIGPANTFANLVILRNSELPPIINSFAPLSAKPGDSITIFGKGFNDIANQNSVIFGSTKGVVTYSTDSTLTVVVPFGAKYSTIKVLNVQTGLISESKDFFNPKFAPSKLSFTSNDFAPRVDFNCVDSSNSYDNEIASADIDGDGKSDMITTNQNAGSISLFRNISSPGTIDSSSFDVKVDFSTGSIGGTGSSIQPVSMALGDLDGDGRTDLVVGHMSGVVSIFRNTSVPGVINENSLAPRINFYWSSNPQSIVINDVDGDGKLDILVTDYGGIAVVLNRCSVGSITANSFSQATSSNSLVSSNLSGDDGSVYGMVLSGYPDGIVSGDFNGDGKQDIACKRIVNSSPVISVLQNSSSRGSVDFDSFQPPIDIPVDYTDYFNSSKLISGDFDSDGKIDLAYNKYDASGAIEIIRNISDSGMINESSFQAPVSFPMGQFSKVITNGDFNGDGKPDFAGGFGVGMVVLLNNSGSNPDNLVDLSVGVSLNTTSASNSFPGSVESIDACDFDGDGKIDLIFKEFNSSVVSILRNSEPPVINQFSCIDSENLTLTILGDQFTGATAVSLGWFGALDFEVNSDNMITATFEYGAEGILTVNTPLGIATASSSFPPIWYLDADNDGYYLQSSGQCSSPGIEWVSNVMNPTFGDCDDNNSLITIETEICDGIDNNCDGNVDENVMQWFYQDNDGDGYGVENNSVLSCLEPLGYVGISGDCNDQFASIFPGSVELCNGLDDDCDGYWFGTFYNTDEGFPQSIFYYDGDNDGFGFGSIQMGGTYSACSTPPGYSSTNTDCNNFNASINPNASEICGNNIDEDCNGIVESCSATGCTNAQACNFNNIATQDDGSCILPVTYYSDSDGDGYGNSAITSFACSQPSGYVTNSNDCNDNNTALNSITAEICNNFDDDCDGVIDNGLTFVNYYSDNDGDGYGAGAAINACSPPVNTVTNNTDCNDNNASLNSSSSETCNNFDDDCDGMVDNGLNFVNYYNDNDGDGYGAGAAINACSPPVNTVTNNTDCNDNNASLNSSSSETCNNFDDDCDGMVDNGLNFVNYYNDNDGDGYGAGAAINACSPPVNTVSNNTDCNDNNAALNSITAEICNNFDDDCNGEVDNGLVFTEYFNDNDGDGYGSGMGTSSCVQIPGMIANGTDCNDNDPFLQLASPELCNYLDDDCNGMPDDGLLYAVYYLDGDGDGYGSLTEVYTCLPSPMGWNLSSNNTDCNDNNAALNTITAETCNNFDDDCDGAVDNGLAFVNYYNDNDGDGYGAGAAINACSPPVNTVTNNTDCNDNNPALNSITVEICNNFDDDCDGTIDNGLAFVNYYNDNDGDGYGAGAAINACSPPVNTVMNNTDCNDNNASVKPGVTEICTNSIDDNCNGQTNENCTTAANGDSPSTAVNVINIGQFGTGTQSTNTIYLANANPSAVGGNDLWYLFTAQHNAIRVGLKGSTTVGDDNRLKLYSYMATPSANMIPIDMEDDVHPGSQGLATDGGDEVLYYDQLVQGQQYWLCVENTNATPGVCTLTISYLMGSQPDIGAYTNNTGVYSNTCGNFKAKYRPNAFQYTVNRHTGNDLSSSIGWSYTIPNTSTTTTTSICQLGKILPPNLTGQMETYYVSVDVYYSMKDAFGNTEEVYANGNVISPVGLNSEADLFLRLADQCPVFKGITSTLSTNRSICGTDQYHWNFAMVYPQSGLPIMVNGAMGGSRILGMSSISGIANGQRYDVKIRTKHVDGVSLSAYGSIKCMRTIGAAGMVLASEEALTVTKTEGLELYPNPNRGDEVRLQVTNMEGVLKIEVLDAMGRLLQSTTEYSDGNITSTLTFETTLANGLYEVRVSNGKEQRVFRMVVGR